MVVSVSEDSVEYVHRVVNGSERKAKFLSNLFGIFVSGLWLKLISREEANGWGEIRTGALVL